MVMKRACITNTNRHEDISCEFHPTFKINYFRMNTKLFITGLAFTALTTMTSAQNNSASQDQKAVTQSARGNYIDDNKNGVCDYYEANGRFNGSGRRMGNARAGNCLRKMAAGQGRGNRMAQGRGMGPGKGRCVAPGGRNFIDENKNGICDLRETPTVK
jgi:hypothetical protein